MSKEVLLARGPQMSHTTHVKGFDSFHASVHETGEKQLKATPEEGGYEVTFIPSHLVGEELPFIMEELKKYDAVVLSDTGANTSLLPSATLMRSEKKPSRYSLIRDYVLDGGALTMMGGYLAFSDTDTKGKWHGTTVQQVLPVGALIMDNRMEYCEGTTPMTVTEYEALNGIPREFPKVLEYSKTIAKSGVVVAAVIDNDLFIISGAYRKGKNAVVTTSCAPHWASSEFCEQGYYNRI